MAATQKVVYVGGFDVCDVPTYRLQFVRNIEQAVEPDVAEHLLLNPDFQPAAKAPAVTAKEA